MYNNRRPNKTTFNKQNVCYEGETIEAKVRRVLNNKEPIKDGSPKIYTDRKDGVLPGMDVRTDRFEIAVDVMDKKAKSHVARRENSIAERAKEGMDAEKKTDKEVPKGGVGGAESIPPGEGK